MKKICQRLALALLICFVLPQPSEGQVGNNNPTGIAGEYNGSITTAGSYDPYTGNGKRMVDDLTVTGSLGAYPLKWTRVLNTRFPAWSGGYGWSLWIRTPDTQLFIPPYDGWDGCVTYPDGRMVNLWFDGESYLAGGAELGDRIVSTGNDNYDLLMKDGGRVRFQNITPNARVFEYAVTEIIDPYGLTTVVTYDSAGRLWKITEPGRRFLQINYTDSSVQAFDGRGNLVETVRYIFQTLTIAGSTGRYLTQVNYDDGAVATYTYQPNNIWAAHYALIETCHDPRYAGVMKDIKYEFVTFANNPNPVVGQVWKEKNATTGQTVSEMIYPGPAPADQLQRREIRGDGSTRLFQYDIWGELASYSDFEGHVSSIRYEDPGFTSDHYFKIFKDARMNETRIKKSLIAGAVLSVKRGNWPAVTYHYTDDQNPYYLDSKTDERGKITTYSRDSNHRIQRTDYPDGGWEEFTYTDLGQVRTHKRTNGVYEAYDHFEYDGRGRLLKRWDPTPSGDYPPSGIVPYSRFTYYESGPSTDRVHFAYDQLGYPTEYQYDGRGNVTRVTYHNSTEAPGAPFSQSHYNHDGTLDWTADENHPGGATDPNQRTRYEYDEYKRVTRVTNPLNESTTNSYNPLNGYDQFSHTTSSVYRTTSPMLRKTDFQYDRNFRRTQTIQAPNTADQAISNFIYDEVGNLHSAEDPRGKITTYGYDDRNRQTSVTNNTPPETTGMEYDDAGNKTKETRPDGSFRTWDHDAMNRVWHAYDWRAAGSPPPTPSQTTTYGHDIAGNVRTITDTKGAVYEYDYDLKNLKTGQKYPVDANGTVRNERMHYDDAGNLDWIVMSPTQSKHIAYDSRNRPWHSWWSPGVGQDIVTSYDAASRVTSIVTNNGETTVAFGYDDANRKIWEDQTLAGQPTRRVKTDPDADGNRLNLEIVDPAEGPVFSPEMQGTGSYSVTYEYTLRNQLKNIHADDGAWTFNYSYDPSGNMTSREAQHDGRSSSTLCPSANYDALNRPTTWEQTGLNGFHALSHHQYDHVNREVATWRDEESSLGERFTYEPTNQLATAVYKAQQVWTTNPLNAERTVSYAYTPDKLNRGSMTDSIAGVTTYSPNALNQYMNTTGNSYSYDSNFNLTHATGFNGVYDAASRLVSASNGGSGEAQQTVAGFVYDGLGRCVKRTLNGVATVFVYDGWKPVAEFDAWNNFLAWNLYGPGADEILLRQQGKYGYIRFQLDRHGNVAFLLDENATVIEKYKYDAFGRPTVTDANGGNVRSWSYYGHCFLFQGREYIRELTIYDYRNRFYLPALGRFLQSDPMGFGAGDMNLFRYVGDDPIDGSDPTGLIMENSAWNRLMVWQDGENGSVSEQLNPPTKSISAESEGNKPAKPISAQDERKKEITPTLRTSKENFKIADKWLVKHYKELGLPDPRNNRPKLVRIPGPAAGDWTPFRGIRLDPYKNKSPAAFVDSYSEELLHAKAGIIHYVRDVLLGDQSPHHQQMHQRSSAISNQFVSETGTRYAEPYTDDR